MAFWNRYLRSATSAEFSREPITNQIIGHRPWDAETAKLAKANEIENGAFQKANALHSVFLNGHSMVSFLFVLFFLTTVSELFKKRFLATVKTLEIIFLKNKIYHRRRFNFVHRCFCTCGR